MATKEKKIGGKRYDAIRKGVEKFKLYSVEEAIDLAKKNATCKFDETIEVTINLNILQKHSIRDTLSLLPIGSKIDYTSIAKNSKSYHELMVNEDGIVSNIYGKCMSMLIPPIIGSKDTGFMKLDFAFTFDQEDLSGEDISSYANMCPTSNTNMNTHVQGVLDGISTWFCNYMNKL